MESALDRQDCQVDSADRRKNEEGRRGGPAPPDHLILLVNGILASASDWQYVERELKKRLGHEVVVHASRANSYFATLQGIDVAGARLADEVRELAQRNKNLKRISIVAHSLGGLIARYAVGMLHSALPLGRGTRQYEPQDYDGDGDEEDDRVEEGDVAGGATLAGLQPVVFVTLATPHLGVRGQRQLPFLLGVGVLEKWVAPYVAQLVVGRTGRQLFLTDCDATLGGRPLLLRMASNCTEGAFMSGLAAFELRVLYANVGYDHMVGWRTSAILKESELPKLPTRALDGRYKHVALVEDSHAEHRRPHSAAQLARDTRTAIGELRADASERQRSAAYLDVLEEEMVAGLNQVPWRRVHVSFRDAFWPFFAHNNIHVKLSWLHFEGAGVVNHLTDTIREQAHHTHIHAKL